MGADDKDLKRRIDGLKAVLGSVSGESERAAMACALKDLSRIALQLQETEEFLREKEGRYRIAARVMRAAIWEWEIRTSKVSWGEGITEIFKYPQETASSDIYFWYERIHPDDRERIVTGIHHAVDSGAREWSEEYRFKTGADSYCEVEDHGWVIPDPEGRPVRMIGAMIDVSKRRQAEEERDLLARTERQALRRVERILKTRDELLDVIAHDLKNPLASILMNVSLARRLVTLPETLMAEPQERDTRLGGMLDRIHAGADRMKELITDAVDLAKSMSGTLSLTLMKRDARVMVRDALRELDPLVRERGVRIELEVGSGDLEAYADCDRFPKMLQRAIAFAIRMSPPGTNVHLSLQNTDDEVVFRLRVPAGAVPEERIPRIFERYGKDIELALVRGVVQALGGRVWSKRGPGGETEISFGLRGVSAQAASTPEEAA